MSKVIPTNLLVIPTNLFKKQRKQVSRKKILDHINFG